MVHHESSIWGEPPPDRGAEGHNVVVKSAAALVNAARQLVQIPGAEKLRIRSGEHLAAILLSAQHSLPVAVDDDGGVDLVFERRDAHDGWPFEDAESAAVEVKSLPGKWRKHESKIKLGDVYEVKIQSSADILELASAKIMEATRALQLKVESSSASKNVFMIIHPMDGLALEFLRGGPVIGHLLPPLDKRVPLDCLWVCWYPTMLSKWSQRDRNWTDYLFADANPSEPPRDESIEDAEDIFLEGIGWSGGSPWMMAFE